jgi:hypothetical protein
MMMARENPERLQQWCCREEMVNWVRKRTGFAATTISTKAEAEAFLNKNVAVVISYFEKFEVGKKSQSFVAWSYVLCLK